MDKSTLAILLDQLQECARERGFTDTDWAARAGIRKETLSRLRHRESCDLETLQALANVVGSSLRIIDKEVPCATADGLFPATIDRDYEERLVNICISGDLNPGRWSRVGPSFFMAGLAVMLASVPDFDRRAFLTLAEQLHAGSSQVGVFALWLRRSPVRPSRFLPMLLTVRRHAA